MERVRGGGWIFVVAGGSAAVVKWKQENAMRCVTPLAPVHTPGRVKWDALFSRMAFKPCNSNVCVQALRLASFSTFNVLDIYWGYCLSSSYVHFT